MLALLEAWLYGWQCWSVSLSLQSTLKTLNYLLDIYVALMMYLNDFGDIQTSITMRLTLMVTFLNKLMDCYEIWYAHLLVIP